MGRAFGFGAVLIMRDIHRAHTPCNAVAISLTVRVPDDSLHDWPPRTLIWNAAWELSG